MSTPDPVAALTIVIGANGAGKTTWARANRQLLPKPFYNADSIAEGLGDPDSAELQAQARRIVDQAIEQDLQELRTFGFESTYSGTSRPAIVQRTRQLGYATHAVFIGTEDHEINIARVSKRVLEGGHSIPTAEIVRRWNAAQENLLRTWTCFDTITIIDNSEIQPEIVAKQHKLSQHVSPTAPPWVRHLLSQSVQTAAARERS